MKMTVSKALLFSLAEFRDAKKKKNQNLQVSNKHVLRQFRFNKPHSKAKGKVVLVFNYALHHKAVCGCTNSSTHAGNLTDL